MEIETELVEEPAMEIETELVEEPVMEPIVDSEVEDSSIVDIISDFAELAC